MTSSFSQYASRFLNNRAGQSSSLASSQPLFYSFQESEDGEDSTGRLRISIQSRDELELDEHGEPRLRGDEDLDDPYLRLDEDDNEGTLKDSAPLITSELPSRQGGWLAHQTSPLPSRSPTPTASPDSPPPPIHYVIETQPTRTTLTESLLPRDGISRSLFSLPEPGRVPRHKYNDTTWTVLWCTAISICAVALLLSLFLINNPSDSTLYSTLTRTVPLLTFLTVMCAGLSYIYILLLHYFARPVLIVTALFIPVSLGLSAISAFSGSFIYDISNTWGDTIGLRLFSIIPILMALLAARSFLWYISQINGTVGTVQLATSLLLSNIPLLGVSPALLFVALLATLPFISLILRLTLLVYQGHSEWHVRPYAVVLAILVCFIWIWSWCVVRGILRVAAAGVVGAWFFKEGSSRESADPMQDQMHAARSAISRACGPSIGTICKAALIQAVVGTFLYLLRGLRRMTSSPMFPASLHPLSIPIMFLSRILIPLSFDGYTLPYVGLTGEDFHTSARRSKEVASIKRPRIMPPSYRLLPILMTLSSLTLSMLLALSSYMFTAHTLSKPGHAVLSALLTGGLTFLASWFCGGIVGDTADALYMCYCIAKESGSHNRDEVFEIFDGPRPINEV